MLSIMPRWRTLEHAGPAFPPPYKALPRGIKLYYAGRPIKELGQTAEEFACLYAQIKMTKHKDTKDKTFNQNFFKDFRDLLSSTLKDRIQNFSQLNFSHIVRYLNGRNRKEETKKEKDKKINVREKLKKKHGFFRINGKLEPLGNFMVEPPGIFRGREGNPHHGRIKRRIRPKDVTLNCSDLIGGASKWKEIVEIKSATWLAKYTNSLGEIKYILPSQQSELKGKDDKSKYEAARKLGNEIVRIRKLYRKGFNSREEYDQQLAVALYFIDEFALRVGHEKGAGEADTVGCCTLRKEHVTLKPGQKLVFDFKGKDSIRFKKEVKVLPKVFKLLKGFLKNKTKKEMLFDELDAKNINSYLKTLSDIKISAKTFRTFHASQLFEKELTKTAKLKNKRLEYLLLAYQKANREVAILCNHKKAVDKRKADKALEKIKNKIRKLERDKSRSNTEKLDILKAKLEAKAQGKDFALGTSKQNYIDPRITIAWCKRYKVPVNKVFSKTLITKYKWAETVSKNFQF